MSEGDDRSDYGSAYGVSDGDDRSDYESAYSMSEGEDGSDYGRDYGVSEGDDGNNYDVSDADSWSDCGIPEDDGDDWRTDYDYDVVADPWTRKPQQKTVMKFYLLRGPGSSLITTLTAAADDDAGAAGGGPDMDAAVWGRMPDELIWEVLRFVPVIKRFELQQVSHKWRRVLTSVHFQKTFSGQQQGSVVACVWPEPCRSDGGDSGTSNSNVKVWEVDLSTVVPSSFCWNFNDDDNGDARRPRPPPWRVVAAANGLVCISTDTQSHHKWQQRVRYLPKERWEPSKPWANRYCVVNPVTRICMELPPPPFQARMWLPPTDTAVAFFGRSPTSPRVWALATYDLAAAAAGGTGGWVTRNLYTNIWFDVSRPWAMLGDETYEYDEHQKVLVVAAPSAAGPGPNGGEEHVVVAELDDPSATLLGVDGPYTLLTNDWRHCVALVAHRGAVYFVANVHLERTLPCCVCTWRLARAADGGDGRMEWEGVTLLDVPEVERLTGFTGFNTLYLENAYAVREFLCCQLRCELELMGEDPHVTVAGKVLLGFNLDTGKWEVLHIGKGLMCGRAMELREEDVFLSSG